MRVFVEEQRFKKWWLFTMLVALIGGILLAFLFSGNDPQAKISMLFPLIMIILVFWLLLSMRLHTRIDNYGIVTRFSPFTFSKKRFSWNDIEKCYLRKYSQREFGGRGLRIAKKKKAYTIGGNQGIQIITKDQRKFLIGTQKPLDAKNVITYYTYKKEEI
ncbi:hypothetical protein C7S20_11185 [Christiangramia fulva]|uniref:Bacterial Pleckstrin homology domain-containing protein n=1 Tax=Christiangramia fulva TaxID=2126553 RepID=A0A2R3Z694_9FLAO|nr:hypothetical protein [Christiangramia fulva]AVR45768.1 hypothetical protein C7S20_11185 [Christiangramia fulva]